MIFRKIVCLAGIAFGSAFAGNVTFNASGVFADNAVLGGSLAIDTGTGVVQPTNVDLTVVGGDAGSPGFVFDTLSSSGLFGPDGNGDNIWIMDFLDSANRDPDMELAIDIGTATTLAGFTGTTSSGVYSMCIESVGNCGFYYSDYELDRFDPFMNVGALTAAPAPEPGSVLLLAGPAVWMIGRRKKAV